MRSIVIGILLGAVLLTSAMATQAGIAAASPTASPSVNRTFVGTDPGTRCRYGYLCAFVRGDGGYYRFDFTRCNTRYRVSGWHGRGFIVNAQYGGVTARFYTRSGRIYASRRARGKSTINWEPVFSLRVC
ncbi:MAG: hypothetical protein WKF96_24035 [Solirubrobacteraceae bacterium]